MKKAFLFLLAAVCSSALAFGQNCDIDFLGTKTLYKTPNSTYTPAPAGYGPVFINHVSRHGARHLTKDVTATLACALLLQADSLNALTPQGRKLKEMMTALQKVEKGSTKSISAGGAAELKGQGERICANYADVFKRPLNLNVAITKEARTKQSADAFLKGLNTQLKSPATINVYNDDNNLRFYDLSPAYKSFEDGVDNSPVKLALEKAEHLDEINNTLAGRIFLPDFLSRLTDDNKEKFVSDLLGFATIVYSLEAEIRQNGLRPADVDFKSFFTCDDLEKLSLIESADEDLKKGPGTDNNGIQVRVAVPLLVNFINTTDEFIKGGKFNAQLRFAHAETIAPFAALLEISTANKVSDDLTKLNDLWVSSKIIPLAANIQWIFYKKGDAGDYLVKVLLNEKEVSITGLDEKMFPYYKWTDLRAFYIEKLNKLNVKLTDDMNTYLAGLK